MRVKDALLVQGDWTTPWYQVLRRDGLLRFYRVGSTFGVSSYLLQGAGELRPAEKKDIFIPENAIIEWTIREYWDRSHPWRLVIRTAKKKYVFFPPEEKLGALRELLSQMDAAAVDMSAPIAAQPEIPWLKPLMLGMTAVSIIASLTFMVLDGAPHSLWARLCLLLMLMIPPVTAVLCAALPMHVMLTKRDPAQKWRVSALLPLIVPPMMMMYETYERNIVGWPRMWVCIGIVFSVLAALYGCIVRKKQGAAVSWLVVFMLAVHSFGGTAVMNCTLDPHPPQVRPGVIHKLREHKGRRRTPDRTYAVVYDETGYHEWQLGGTIVRDVEVSDKVEVQVYPGLLGVECVHIEKKK